MAATDVSSAASLASALRGANIATPWAGASLLASGLGLKGPLSMGGYSGGTRGDYNFTGQQLYGGTDDLATVGRNNISAAQAAELQSYGDQTQALLQSRMAELGITNPAAHGIRLSYTGTPPSPDAGGRKANTITANFGTNYLNQPSFKMRGIDYTSGSGDPTASQQAIVDAYINQIQNPQDYLTTHLDKYQPDKSEEKYDRAAGIYANTGQAGTLSGAYSPDRTSGNYLAPNNPAYDPNAYSAAWNGVSPYTANKYLSATDTFLKRGGTIAPQSTAPEPQPVPPQTTTPAPQSVPPQANTNIPVPNAPIPQANTNVPPQATPPSATNVPQQWAGPATQHHTPMQRNYWMGQKITNPQQWNWRQSNPNQLATGLRA